MSNENNVPTATFALGDQMTGTCESRTIDPPRREAQRFEGRIKQVPDGTHASEVHRPAIDADRLFQQLNCGVLLTLYSFDESPFGA
jgi:hypothetical protein